MMQWILFLILMTCLIYVGIIYASSAFVLLAFAGIFFLVAVCLFLAAACFLTKCSFSLPIRMAEENQSVEYEIIVEKRGILPLAKLKCVVGYEIPMTGKKGKIKLSGMADAGGRTILKGKIRIQECGGYRFTLKKIKIYDLTGLFSFTCYPKKKWAALSVMPQMQEFHILVTEASRHFMGEADDYDDTIGGDDVSEIFQIRPFRNGDKLQSIHWKMSAKTEELMVRESSQPLSCPVVVFLDITGRKKRKGNFYGLVLSISYSLVLAHCPHYIAWYSSREKDVIRVRVADEESLYLFLLTLYEEKAEKKEQDVKSLYCEKYKGDFWVTDLSVDLEGTVKRKEQLIEKPEDVEIVV